MITLLREARPGRMQVAPSVLSVNRAGGTAVQELTARELEVLGYIGQGLEVKAIAQVLGISVHTCRGYIKTIYATLHVSSRIGAVNRGRELGLLTS